MICAVEEEVLHMDGFMVAVGLIGQLKRYNEAKLTTCRISYKHDDEVKHIYLSSIRKCQMKRHLLRQLIKLVCVDTVYYVTYDGGVEHLYQTILEALGMHDTHNVIVRSQSMGGISRIMNMKLERIGDNDHLRINATADLRALKQKSLKMLEMARGFNRGRASLSKVLEPLNLDIFSDETGLANQKTDVEHMVTLLLRDNDFILLQDLFCAVNRMKLCGFLSPMEVLKQVKTLEHNGICSIEELHGVNTIFSKNTEDSLDALAQLVATGPITVFQLAETQGISICLAEHKLLYAQREGVVTRDDDLYCVRYYHNPFGNWK